MPSITEVTASLSLWMVVVFLGAEPGVDQDCCTTFKPSDQQSRVLITEPRLFLIKLTN